MPAPNISSSGVMIFTSLMALTISRVDSTANRCASSHTATTAAAALPSTKAPCTQNSTRRRAASALVRESADASVPLIAAPYCSDWQPRPSGQRSIQAHSQQIRSFWVAKARTDQLALYARGRPECGARAQRDLISALDGESESGPSLHARGTRYRATVWVRNLTLIVERHVSLVPAGTAVQGAAARYKIARSWPGPNTRSTVTLPAVALLPLSGSTR